MSIWTRKKEMKKGKSIKSLSMVLVLMLNILPVSAAHFEPLSQYIECEESYNVLSKTQSNIKILALSFGLWYDQGDSYTVTTEMTQSVSNSATFTIIPEFLELGYEVTYTSSYSIGSTITNNLSYMRESALFRIADVFAVTMFVYVGYNSCQIINTTKTVYKGYNYSFKN